VVVLEIFRRFGRVLIAGAAAGCQEVVLLRKAGRMVIPPPGVGVRSRVKLDLLQAALPGYLQSSNDAQ